MAIVNSNQKLLPTHEVIATAVVNAHRSGQLGDIPVQSALLVIAREGAMPNCDVMQIGNTVFISHFDDSRVEVAFRALNADTARNYVDNIVEYLQRLVSSGVRRMTCDFADPKILQVIKTIMRRPDFSRWGVSVYPLSTGEMRAYIVVAKE